MLKCLSFIYTCAVGARNLLYRLDFLKAIELEVPVISVGNLSTGGTGKTPLVRYITSYYRMRGIDVAVLIRGYRRRTKTPTPLLVRNRSAIFCTEDAAGDEPYMLALDQDATIVVGRNRIASSAVARREGSADVIVLDDGFQYRRLARDLDIVTMSAARSPFGDYPLPLGELREPVASLHRADVAVCIGEEYDEAGYRLMEHQIMSIDRDIMTVIAMREPCHLYHIGTGGEISLEYLRGRGVALLCAIADPHSFERTVSTLQARVEERFFYPDHSRYSSHQIEGILKACRRRDISILLITEKDYVKLSWLKGTTSEIQILVLKVRIRLLKGSETFHRRLDQICAR
jgi:tetraacyldisaccharide 4'-kinase